MLIKLNRSSFIMKHSPVFSCLFFILLLMTVPFSVNAAQNGPPQNAKQWVDQGDAQYQKRNYQAAIQAYDKAIAMDPKNVNAYNNRGLAYNNLKQYPKALADYNKALALNPKNGNVYNNRAGTYINLKQYALAIADFDKVITFEPQYATAYYYRGYALFKLNRKQEAIASLQQCIECSTDKNLTEQAKENIRQLGGTPSDSDRSDRPDR